MIRILIIVLSDVFLSVKAIKLNENISAPIVEGDVLGNITYNIDGITYSSDLIASHSVEEFNTSLVIIQIILAIIVLLILIKLIFSKKKKSKRKKSNNYNRMNKMY